jgi:hypothetical protein
MSRTIDERASFRCTVSGSDSRAKILVGGIWQDCAVVNTSRDGFGVRVKMAHGKKLLKAERIQLKFRNEHWDVTLASEFCDDDKTMTVGLLRQTELTKLNLRTSMGLSMTPKFSSSTDPSFLLALVVAFLLTCVCLPGIGTHLGTAPKVRETVNTVVNQVIETFN